MRAPIKLNRAYWPALLHSIVPSANDARVLLDKDIDEFGFSQAVSSFSFRSTLKATQKNRFPKSIQFMCGLQFQQHPVVLDVGCSDGITSLDVMRSLPFSRYYATDLNTEVFCTLDNGRGFFYDRNGVPIMIVTNRWIVYNELNGAIRPFSAIARRMIEKAPKMGATAVRIPLVNPTLKNKLSEKVIFKRHDLMQSWTDERVDLVIAANILNRCYFSDAQLSLAVRNLRSALKNSGGYVTIIDNRPNENSTIFQVLPGRAQIVHRVDGGTDIESLALEALCS